MKRLRPGLNLHGARLINPPAPDPVVFQLPWPSGEKCLLDNLPFTIEAVNGDRLILRFRVACRLVLKPADEEKVMSRSTLPMVQPDI